jgi:hypothetical protein
MTTYLCQLQTFFTAVFSPCLCCTQAAPQMQPCFRQHFPCILAFQQHCPRAALLRQRQPMTQTGHGGVTPPAQAMACRRLDDNILLSIAATVSCIMASFWQPRPKGGPLRQRHPTRRKVFVTLPAQGHGLQQQGLAAAQKQQAWRLGCPHGSQPQAALGQKFVPRKNQHGRVGKETWKLTIENSAARGFRHS